MAATSLPINAAPTTAPAQAPTTAQAMPTAAPGGADVASDFTEMLKQLLGGSSDPTALAILNALQSTSTSTLKDDSKPAIDSGAEPSALNVDPQVLLAAVAQALKMTQATPAVATPANASAHDARGDLDVLAVIGGSSAAKLDATLLASVANGASKEGVETRNEGDRTVAEAVAPPQTQNTARAKEPREMPAIRSHVGTPAWADELASRLTVMVGRGLHSASLQLSPEQLGPLEIRISVQNDQTSVWFGAAHAETRAALEQSLPRLRELLAGQGLNLSDAGVSHQAPRDRQKTFAGAAEQRGEEREFSIAAIAARGIVDAYA